MDMEKYNAPLVIDGLDCVRMGLFDLRSKIGIIPQSPVLFSGTIRSNMVSQFSCFIQLFKSKTYTVSNVLLFRIHLTTIPMMKCGMHLKSAE